MITPLPNGQGHIKLVSAGLGSVEEDVVEALLRFQAEHSVPKDTHDYRFDFIFVGFNGADPGVSFMQRFADLRGRVRPLSSASTSSDGVFDQKSGQRGVLCSYQSIRWEASDKVQVEGKIFVAGSAGAGITYTLSLQGGKWRVTATRVNWES